MCTKKAEWEINYGRSPDDYTHACEAHVGELLSVGVNTVFPFHAADWPLSGESCRCCFIDVDEEMPPDWPYTSLEHREVAARRKKAKDL